MSRLRSRQPRAGAVLHVVRRRAVAALPRVRRGDPARREVLHRVRHRALRRAPASPASPAGRPRRRPRSGARPRSCSPTSPATRRWPSEWTRRPSRRWSIAPCATRRGDRALRRLDRQVHRRQRDGGLRRAGRARGRPRARGARRPRDAGGDGGINRQSREKYEVGFSLRVGINTGEVMAGAVGDGYTVIGDTVNVAARLQAAGRPGTVTVGEPTYRAQPRGDLLRAARAADA